MQMRVTVTLHYPLHSLYFHFLFENDTFLFNSYGRYYVLKPVKPNLFYQLQTLHHYFTTSPEICRKTECWVSKLYSFISFSHLKAGSGSLQAHLTTCKIPAFQKSEHTGLKQTVTVTLQCRKINRPFLLNKLNFPCLFFEL